MQLQIQLSVRPLHSKLLRCIFEFDALVFARYRQPLLASLYLCLCYLWFLIKWCRSCSLTHTGKVPSGTLPGAVLPGLPIATSQTPPTCFREYSNTSSESSPVGTPPRLRSINTPEVREHYRKRLEAEQQAKEEQELLGALAFSLAEQQVCMWVRSQIPCGV